MTDWETYQTAYAEASSQLQDYLVSNELVSLVNDLCLRHEIPREKGAILVTLLSDRILSLVNSSKLVEKLGELNISGEAIIEMSDVSDTIVKQFQSEAAPGLETINSEKIAPEMHQAESALNTIRTMPPTPDETVYTSTQSAILSEGAATLPTADPSAPRWDSSR